MFIKQRGETMSNLDKLIFICIMVIHSCNPSFNEVEIEKEYSVINQAIPQLKIRLLDINTYLPTNKIVREWHRKNRGYSIQLSQTEKKELINILSKKDLHYNDEILEQFEILIVNDSLESIEYSNYGYKKSIAINLDKINIVKKCLFVNNSSLLAKRDENYNRHISFSRVLFDKSGEKALFEASIGDVGESGTRNLIFLEQVNGAWLIVKEKELYHYPL